jgi:hypothetical protein
MWLYEFHPASQEAWRISQGVKSLLDMVLKPVKRICTEREFEALRDSLKREGIVLLHVTRTPWREPEPVR